MAILELDGFAVSGQSRLDWNIRDITVIDTPAGQVAYTVTGWGGGIAAWALAPGAAPVLHDYAFYSWAVSTVSIGQGVLLDHDGTRQLITAGEGTTGLLGHALDPHHGAIAKIGATPLPALGSDLTAVAVARVGAADVILTADVEAAGRLRLYADTGAGWRLAASEGERADSHLGGISALLTAQVGGTTYALVASTTEHMISAYRVDPGGDGLVLTGAMGAARGLGLQAPSALALADLGGRSYLLVAGGGSSTLGVMEITADGRLVPTDQLLDSRDSRFAAVQAVETVAVGDHVFVLAAGGDQGVSLLRLLPGGRLLHLEAIPGSLEAGLERITAIAATVLGDGVQVLVAGQASAGLTRFRIETADLGQVQTGTGGADRLVGGAGCDVLSGFGGADRIEGGAGDDILDDGFGADTLIGGAGADIFVLRWDGATDAIADFRPGTDRLDLSDFQMLYDPAGLGYMATARGGILTWRGQSTVLIRDTEAPITWAELQAAVLRGPDRPAFGLGQATRGTAAAEALVGDWGADRMEGLDGADTLSGAEGDDTLVGGAGNDLIAGADGQDLILGGTGRDTAFGGAGDDSLDGGADNDVLDGGAGHDTLIGGGGNDRLYGGAGQDSLSGGAGTDFLFGGLGDDTLDGGPQADVLSGMEGRDLILGGLGNDLIYAGGAADTVIGAAGADTIFGGWGDDSLDGGAGADLIFGLDGADDLWGAGGDDVLHAGEGADTAAGGDGADRIFGGGGSDRLYGGGYGDTIFAGWGHDTVDGGWGADEIHGMDGNDLIFGGDGPDRIFGGANYDTVFAGAGDDVVWGGPGSDRIWLGDGHDLFRDTAQSGPHADDRVWGGAGNDTLHSAGGNDTLIGWTGADSFVIEPGAGRVRIEDFIPGTDQLILALPGLGPGAVERSIAPEGIVLDLGLRDVLLAGLTGDPATLDLIFV